MYIVHLLLFKKAMPPPISCCNPLNKKKHKCVYKNVKRVNENWSSVFQNLIGKYVCHSCSRSILKSNSLPPLQDQNKGAPQPDWKKASAITKDINDDELSSDDEMDCEKKDASYESESKNDTLKRKSPNNSGKNVKAKKRKLRQVNENIIKEDDIRNQTFINEIRVALSKATSKQDKYKILTTLPWDCSIRKIQKTCNVSRRVASNAKKIRQLSGYGASCEKKAGRPLLKNVIEEVENFYAADQQSRLLAGRKEFVNISNGDNVKSVQKRLLLFDIKEVHKKFILKHPEIKISLSTFTKLRPRFCIPVGSKGTHNVCVCHIHQNMKLKLIGLNDTLKKKGAESEYNLRDVLKLNVCENPTSSCFLLNCNRCPGADQFVNKVSKLFEDYGIEEIIFKSWTKTDR